MAFAAGYLSGLQLPPSFLIALFLILSLHDFPNAFLIAFVAVIGYYLKIDVFEKFSTLALWISILGPIIFYLSMGIPLFQWGLRYKIVGPLVLFALLGAGGLTYSKFSTRAKTLFLLAYSVVYFLGTFRSLLLLGYIPYLLDYTLSRERKWHVVIFGSALLGMVLIMSGSISALLVRIGFTFLVFHNLVRISLPWGYFHGSVLFSEGPRALVSQLFGASTNYTYFFFGQAVADFGIFGLLEAFLLGLFLRESEREHETFVFVCSLMIYALDSGIDALILMFIIGALIFQDLRLTIIGTRTTPRTGSN